jgi:hypothetical protein
MKTPQEEAWNEVEKKIIEGKQELYEEVMGKLERQLSMKKATNGGFLWYTYWLHRYEEKVRELIGLPSYEGEGEVEQETVKNIADFMRQESEKTL